MLQDDLHFRLFNTNFRPYVKWRRNGDDRIDFITNDRHVNSQQYNKTYHFYYQGGDFYKSDGTLITSFESLPISSQSTNLTTAWQAESGKDQRSWIFDLTLDGSNHPVATFGVYDSNFTRHEYWQSRWDGSAWSAHKVCDGGGPLSFGDAVSYSGLAITAPFDANAVYCSRRVKPDGSPAYNGGEFHLWKYVSSDGGVTWTGDWLSGVKPEFGSGIKQARPYIADGMPDRLWYWQGEYTHYLDRYTAQIKSVGI